MKYSIALIVALSLLYVNANSQVYINKSKPLSKIQYSESKNSSVQSTNSQANGLSKLSTLKQETVQFLSINTLAKRVDKIRELRPNINPIALPINTDFSIENSGKWDTLTNGDRVWRLNINMTGNGSSILVFEKLTLPYGTFMHIFDKDKDFSLGPFNFNTNSDGGGWMTHLLPFSNIVIEYVQPKDVLGTPQLKINKVGQILSTDISPILNESKLAQTQGKMPPIGVDTNVSDYRFGVNFGRPASCVDTLEAYAKSMCQYIYLSRIHDTYDSLEYDSFDLKNATLLSTTDPNDCKAYIATVAHVAWQDSLFLRDYTAFRFNWIRTKPTDTCCIYPKTTDWSTTIDFSQVVDYTGGIRRVRSPARFKGDIQEDFALIEMLDYPIHNAYFSDWNAECLNDSIGIELKLLTHKIGYVPLMYKLGYLNKYFCPTDTVLNIKNEFKINSSTCDGVINSESGDSGSGLFKKKNGNGLFDYEYIGTLTTSNSNFTAFNWIYDSSIPSNRTKTYLDPLNTGATKNNGYFAMPHCQTADCCELIFTKIRPAIVQADMNNDCCTNLIIEEKFPDDIGCGDYTVLVTNIATSDTVLNELITPEDIRYPNLFVHEICEHLPIGFLDNKKFTYKVQFIKSGNPVVSCERELSFTCQQCNSNDLEVTVIPSKIGECCYDIKIKELTPNACQFKHLMIKGSASALPIVYSSDEASVIGINKDSIYFRGICESEVGKSFTVYLYNNNIELDDNGYPLRVYQDRHFKEASFTFDDGYCKCCDYITIEDNDSADCNEFIIKQEKQDEFQENCGIVDSVKVDLLDSKGKLVIENFYNDGGLSSNSINNIDVGDFYKGHSSGAKLRFSIFDEEGNLICIKETRSSCNNCTSISTGYIFGTNTDEDPCCQTIKLLNNSTKYNDLTANIYEVTYDIYNNPIISSPLNSTEILVSHGTYSSFEVCLDQESKSYIIEFKSEGNIVCKDILTLICNTCCIKETGVGVEFEMIDDSTSCCYIMNLDIMQDSCDNIPSYMKVVNKKNDSTEYQGSVNSISTHEFCLTNSESIDYKIEFFSSTSYSDEDRLCVEEATLKPCTESCCEDAYIEQVIDTTITDPWTCCWKFNVQNFNCDVYRVEIFDNYYNPHFLYVDSNGLSYGTVLSDRYELGSENFMPYYSEGLNYGDTNYLNNGPIDLETLSERITQQICINKNPSANHDPYAPRHGSIIIRLFDEFGEECILNTNVRCEASNVCCNFASFTFKKLAEEPEADSCCWKFGIYIDHFTIPSICNSGELRFTNVKMYHDVYDTVANKFISELYQMDSPEFMPYYVNTQYDTVGWNDLYNISPTICQIKGKNPTDKIIIKAININGDTCTIKGHIPYCNTEEEELGLIEFTSSMNNTFEVELDEININVNEQSTVLEYILNLRNTNIEFEIFIYDVLGKQQRIEINQNQIDISNLSNGAYYFVLKTNNQVVSKPFTIVR